MFFDFGFKSSILLFFFLHGLIFSSLLFIKGWQQENRPGLWLGLFTLLCSLYIAPFVFGYAGWYANPVYRDILFYSPLQQLLLLPPVLYFYFKTLLDRSFRFSKQQLLHFVPAALYLLYSLTVVIIDKLVLQEYYFYKDGKDKDLAIWYQVVGFLSLSYYLFLSIRDYNKYRSITYNTVSFTDAVMFKWAQRFLVAFLLLLIARGLFFILNPEWDEFGKKFWYYICFSILFYYISISGYANSLRSYTSFRELPLTEPEIQSIPKPGFAPVIEPVLKEASPEIPDLENWKAKIDALMLQEKFYENPELTISHLSEKLGTHPKKISQVINQGFNLNFNDFVNQHRVRAVIQKIEEGEHTLQTLAGIAFDAGFNSKSTFNRAFKKYTQFTPKEFIEKMRRKYVSNQDMELAGLANQPDLPKIDPG